MSAEDGTYRSTLWYGLDIQVNLMYLFLLAILSA